MRKNKKRLILCNYAAEYEYFFWLRVMCNKFQSFYATTTAAMQMHGVGVAAMDFWRLLSSRCHVFDRCREKTGPNEKSPGSRVLSEQENKIQVFECLHWLRARREAQEVSSFSFWN